MKKNILTAAVLISSLALCTSAFAVEQIDAENSLEIGGATFKVSTGVTLSTIATTTIYGVVGKHLSGDIAYGADSIDSTTRIFTAKDAGIVGQIPTVSAVTLVPAGTDPASITTAYTLAAPAG